MKSHHAALLVAFAVVCLGCRRAKPRADWRRQVSASDAGQLVAQCMPGAVLDDPVGARTSGWSLVKTDRPEDPQPFTLHMSFTWKDEARTKLDDLAVRSSGGHEHRTPVNARLYRDAIGCAFRDLVPSEFLSDLFGLVDSLGSPGSNSAWRGGFLLSVSDSRGPRGFFSDAAVSAPYKRP